MQQKLLPVLEKTKSAYILWHSYHLTLTKIHRHTLGAKIDTLFIELIESLSVAVFLAKDEKFPYVRLAMRKLDTIKILLLILFETKSIDSKKYIALSILVDEVGKMLGGWHGQLTREHTQKKN